LQISFHVRINPLFTIHATFPRFHLHFSKITNGMKEADLRNHLWTSHDPSMVDLPKQASPVVAHRNPIGTQPFGIGTSITTIRAEPVDSETPIMSHLSLV
jgi:hypothetical protein